MTAQNPAPTFISDSETGETSLFCSDAQQQLSRAVAAEMTRRGIAEGDACLTLTMDVGKTYAFTMGVWRVGGVLIPCNPEDPAELILSRLVEESVNFVLCDKGSVQVAREAVSQAPFPVQLLVVGDDDVKEEGTTSVDDHIYEEYQWLDHKETDIDDPFLIFCTSGITQKSSYLHGGLHILPDLPKSGHSTGFQMGMTAAAGA